MIEIYDADGKLMYVASGDLSVTVTTGRPAPTGNKLESKKPGNAEPCDPVRQTGHSPGRLKAGIEATNPRAGA